MEKYLHTLSLWHASSQAWVRGAGRRPEELVLYLPPSQDGSDDAILSAVHIFPVRRAASSSVDRA